MTVKQLKSKLEKMPNHARVMLVMSYKGKTVQAFIDADVVFGITMKPKKIVPTAFIEVK